MLDDIFLKIIAGEIPAHKVYEDEYTYAFLDATPNNPGHTLVIPKERYKDIYEIPEEVLSHVMNTVKKVAIAVKKATNADGINIGMNNEPAAGQLVFHAHIHVIPRFKDDGLKHWGKKEYKEGEAEKVAESIRAEL